jgi:hypothetical protein
MKAFLNKLKSRKFLTCIAGVVMGICMVFGVDEGDMSTIAGAVTAVISIVSYIHTEGKIDAQAVGQLKDVADDVKDAIDVVEKIEE